MIGVSDHCGWAVLVTVDAMGRFLIAGVLNSRTKGKRNLASRDYAMSLTL
jgi:hypothetical protein